MSTYPPSLTVIGATGGTGRQVVAQALAAGSPVTAVVRNPAPLADLAHPHLSVVTADVTDADALKDHIAGRDAVVSALGTRTGRQPTTICSAGAAATVAAMRTTGVRRLSVVSAAGLAVEDGDGFVLRYIAKPLVSALFRYAYDDLRLMERQVAASGLDWTVYRPPRLTNGRRTGRYRTAVGHGLPRCRTISRADLAAGILAALADPATYGGVVSIAY